MKLQLFNFENDVFLDSNYINVIEIHNCKLFANITQTFSAISQGMLGLEKLYLYEDNIEISFDGNMLYVGDPWQIDFNSKKIQNSLFLILKNSIKNEERISKELENYYNEILTEVRNIADDFEIDLEYAMKIDHNKLFKFLGICICEINATTLIDKLTTFLKVVANLQAYKFIVFCNLKLYLNNEALVELYKLSLYLKLPILLLETIEKEPLEIEKKLIIDETYDEFIVCK